MLYQTIWMAIYDSKNLLNISIRKFIKHIFVDILTILVGGLFSFKIPMLSIDYFSWIFLAIIDTVVWEIIIIGINTIN